MSEQSYSFSKNQLIKLIRLFKNEELLWNKNMIEYKDKKLRIRAMNNIMKNMNLPDLNVTHVKLKLRILRDMYVRELKRIGTSSGTYNRSFPFWFHNMHFLKEHLNTSYDLSDIQVAEFTDDAEENYFGYEDDTASAPFESKEERLSDDADDGEDHNIFIVQSDHDNRSNDDDTEPDRPKPKRTKLGDTSIEISGSSDSTEDRLVALESSQTAILNHLQNATPTSQEDYFENFARYVASLLRALPKSKAFALQPKIISMITAEHTRLPVSKSADK